MIFKFLIYTVSLAAISAASTAVDLGGKYLKIRTLGGGATAVAYEVIKGGNRYALKKAKNKGDVLTDEFHVMKIFSGIEGFPKVYELFKCPDGCDCLVMELVGPIVTDIQKNLLPELPLETAASIGIQLIDRMETMHKAGVVHGDLFRNNIAPGKGDQKGLLYAIDFGQAVTGRRKSFDVDSVVSTIHSIAKKSRRTHNGDSRKSEKGIKEVQSLVKYADGMDKDADPDYKYMRGLMVRLLEKSGKKYEGRLIWPSSLEKEL